MSSQEIVESRVRNDATVVAVTLASMFLAYRLFSALAGSYILKHYALSNSGLYTNAVISRSAGLFVLAEMFVITAICRNQIRLLITQYHSQDEAKFRDISIGTGVGVLTALCVSPFLLGFDANIFVRAVFLPLRPLHLGSVLNLFLFVVALPCSGEVVFRGIFQRTLSAYVNPTAQIFVTATSFAFIWPTFNFVFAFFVGLAAGILYQRRGSILSCIIVNVLATSLGIALVILT